jgi:hypothetical protein
MAKYTIRIVLFGTVAALYFGSFFYDRIRRQKGARQTEQLNQINKVPAKAEQPTKSPKPPEQNQSKSVPEKTKTEGTQGIFEGTKLKRDPLSLLDSDKKQ